MDELRVRELMTTPVISITPQTRLPQIKNVMHLHKIRRLAVMDQDQLVGIVSLSDVLTALPSDLTTIDIYAMINLLYKVTARELMQHPVISIDADASITEAAQHMLEHRISGLPVLDHGRVVGMITESDIFRAVMTKEMGLVA